MAIKSTTKFDMIFKSIFINFADQAESCKYYTVLSLLNEQCCDCPPLGFMNFLPTLDQINNPLWKIVAQQ